VYNRTAGDGDEATKLYYWVICKGDEEQLYNTRPLKERLKLKKVKMVAD